MERYQIPAAETRVEIKVQNSRFIATAAPVFSVEDAKAFVARIRAEFPDATHNVPVFLVGHGTSVIAHASDDGEPSGTAGRPALAVLQGSGLGDVAVVITRYFGGTKLGTGGLVRAYGDAVRALLEVLPRAHKVPTHTLLVATPYPLFERLRQTVEAHGGQILDEEFATDVTVTARFPMERVPAFQAAVQELRTAGSAAPALPGTARQGKWRAHRPASGAGGASVETTIVASDEATIIPLD